MRMWPAGRGTLRIPCAPIIFIFVKNIFVNGGIITKFTKILYRENLELYSIIDIHILTRILIVSVIIFCHVHAAIRPTHCDAFD